MTDITVTIIIIKASFYLTYSMAEDRRGHRRCIQPSPAVAVVTLCVLKIDCALFVLAMLLCYRSMFSLDKIDSYIEKLSGSLMLVDGMLTLSVQCNE